MKKILILSIWTILIICSPVYSGNLDVKWVGGITITPASPIEGNAVKIEGTFRATWSAVDNLKITGGIDGTTIYNHTFAHIDQGVNTNINFNWTATSGNHSAWFTIDPDNTSGDSNISNNNIDKAFVVSSTIAEFPKRTHFIDPKPFFKPDLIIQSIEVVPASPHLADPVTLKVQIKNIGLIASSESTLKTVLRRTNESGTIIGEGSAELLIPPIGINKIHIFEYARHNFENEGTGKYWFSATADYLNTNNEFNETNNSKVLVFKVSP